MSNQRSLKEIVELIASETGFGKDEIHQLINDKMDELGDFVTELGAAHIVARENNVDLSSEPTVRVQSITPISQLDLSKSTEDNIPTSNINILGRISKIADQHSFQRNDGTTGVLQSATVYDKTGSIRVVFWDEKAKELQDGNCKSGDLIRIFNGYTKKSRDGESIEVHLGRNSQIQIRPSGVKDEDLPLLQTTIMKINEIKDNQTNITTVGKITQIDDKRDFARSDSTTGQKLAITVGDETGEIYVNFWNEKTILLDDFKLGDIVEITDLNSKSFKGSVELHFGGFSKIKKSSAIKDIVVKKGLIITNEVLESQLTKIKDINETLNNNYTSIKGIIINVTPLHEFSRDNKTTGKVRNLTLSDDTDIIRVVIWDDKTQLITENDVDKLATIVNGIVRIREIEIRGVKYSRTEFHCGKDAQINIEDVESDIYQQHIVGFNNLDSISENQEFVHVRGIVSDKSPIQEIETKETEIVNLRNFKIEDSTAEVRFTCWRENVEKISDFNVGDQVEIYYAKVKEDTGYGVGLQVTRDTIIKKSLYGEISPNDFVSGLSVSKIDSKQQKIQDIEDIKEDDYVTIQATVIKLIEKQFVYALCPECKKKLDEKEGKYTCERHDDIDSPLNRILFTFVVNDGTGNINVFCAGDLAEKILGMDANSALKMVNEQESEKAPYTFLLKNKNFVNSELVISGKVNKNPFLDSLEIVARSIEEVRFKEATNNLLNNMYSE